jgi:hypothetical protein
MASPSEIYAKFKNENVGHFKDWYLLRMKFSPELTKTIASIFEEFTEFKPQQFSFMQCMVMESIHIPRSEKVQLCKELYDIGIKGAVINENVVRYYIDENDYEMLEILHGLEFSIPPGAFNVCVDNPTIIHYLLDRFGYRKSSEDRLLLYLMSKGFNKILQYLILELKWKPSNKIFGKIIVNPEITTLDQISLILPFISQDMFETCYWDCVKHNKIEFFRLALEKSRSGLHTAYGGVLRKVMNLQDLNLLMEYLRVSKLYYYRQYGVIIKSGWIEGFRIALDKYGNNIDATHLAGIYKRLKKEKNKLQMREILTNKFPILINQQI